jgi:hypothetical protein
MVSPAMTVPATLGSHSARQGEMMGIRSIILAVLLLTAEVAPAEMNSTFNIGVGQFSCGKLIAAIGHAPPGSHEQMTTPNGIFIDEHTQYQEWMTGFVSGYNFAHSAPGDEQKKQVRAIDQAGMDLWMRNWCNQHPTQTVFQASAAFINEMLTNATAGRH